MSTSGGTLTAGASQTVTASVNANANTLTVDTHTDTLVFSNVTNGTGNTSRNVSLTVNTPSSDGRVSTGLVVLYDFEEGTGTTVHDKASGSPVDLQVANASAAPWVTGGLSVNSATIVQSTQAATKLIDACKASNAITIEAWLRPANTSQGGPARVFTLSNNSLDRNFTLGQASTQYEVRLRSTSTSDNGIPAVVTPSGEASTAMTHVVYTRAASGDVRVYVDGAESVSGNVAGDLSNWNGSYKLALANELSQDRPWVGELHLVAAYDRALSVTEVQQNYDAGPGVAIVDPGQLSVTPSTGLTSSGSAGGPFSPSSSTFTLTNSGNDAITWSASKTVNWVSLSSTGGSLNPGANVSVTVSLNANANGLAAGTYSDTVTFTNETNGAGNTTRNVSLTVTASGLAVNAGPDQAVMLPDLLALNATVTENGAPVASPTPGWSKVSGPGTVTFSNATSVNPTVNFGAAGTYVLRLTASNGTQTLSDELTAYVLPLIRAEASPSSGTMPLTVQFSAMEGGILASTVPAGSTFQWNFGDGTMATGTQVSHTYTSSGTFTATLTLVLAGSLGSFSCGQVTTQVASDGSTPQMTTASRTSGVAPLGVFFDCINDPNEPWSSGVVQPRGFDDQPTISGVKITRVEYGTPMGNGTLTYTASSKTLRWQASGEAAGAAVNVSAGRLFALPSGGGRNLHVWVNPAALPGGNESDTIQIVDGGINADWASFHYEWDFGNPAPGGTSPTDPQWYWEQGAKKSNGSWFSKNKAFGWNAAHVYEDAGTYTARLKIIDDVDGVYEYTQTITVTAEPPGGWTTFHFASNGNDTTGDGSQAKPFKTWTKARAWAGPNTRLLFKRGDTFVVDSAMSPSINAPFMIGAYGSGERPQFTCGSGVGFLYGKNVTDARLIDLWVDGTYPPQVPGVAFALGKNCLVSRCRVQDMNAAFSFMDGGKAILADSEATNSKKYSVWVSASPRTSILGCDISETNEETLLRTYTNKIVVSHCFFHDNPEGLKKHIRFMAGDSTGQGGVGQEGRWNSCSFNRFEDFGVATNSEGPMVSHFLCNANVFLWYHVTDYAPLAFKGTLWNTVTNNRIYRTTSGAFMNNEQDYNGYAWTSHAWRFLNNSAHHATDSSAWARGTDFTTNHEVRGQSLLFLNNALSAPTATYSANTFAFRAPTAESPVLTTDYNCWQLNAVITHPITMLGSSSLKWDQWQDFGHDEHSIFADPAFVNSTNGDLRLKAGSSLIDAGTDAVLPWCRVDADGNVRTAGAVNIGALE